MAINRSFKTLVAYFWFLDRNSQEKDADWKSPKRRLREIKSCRWILVKYKNIRYGNKIIAWLDW